MPDAYKLDRTDEIPAKYSSIDIRFADNLLLDDACKGAPIELELGYTVDDFALFYLGYSTKYIYISPAFQLVGQEVCKYHPTGKLPITMSLRSQLKK